MGAEVNGTRENGVGAFAGRRILYAVSTMGLGHAQRSLPLLRGLVRGGAALTVVSHGRGLEALKLELGGRAEPIRFVDVPDYPPLQRGRGLWHYALYLWDLVGLGLRARDEGRVLARLHAETPFDLVIADGRFGWVTPGVRSVLVIHQVKVLLPRGFRLFQGVSDAVQRRIVRRHHHLVILDHPDPALTLAGRLSHTPILKGLPQTWIGPVSTVDDRGADEVGADAGAGAETDLLFVMGGFIEAERRRFVAWIKAGVAAHPGLRVGLLLGGGAWAPDELPAGARVFPMALGAERERLMRGARLIVGRTGHTTVMDIRALGGRALLFPTPGMTEHVELARMVRGFRHEIKDPEARALAESLEALARPGLPRHLQPVRIDASELPEPLRQWTTAQSVGRFEDAISRLLDAPHLNFPEPLTA